MTDTLKEKRHLETVAFGRRSVDFSDFSLSQHLVAFLVINNLKERISGSDGKHI